MHRRARSDAATEDQHADCVAKSMQRCHEVASKGQILGASPLHPVGQFNEELVKAGIMLAGEGLKPSSKGVRVRFSGKERTVIDGPFAETKELVAGYWIWQVKSMDEAIAWLKRRPCPMT